MAARRRAVGYTTVVIGSPLGRSTLREAVLDVYLAAARKPRMSVAAAPLPSPLHASGELRIVLQEVITCGT